MRPYGRRAISNVGVWPLPKPILKYSYKQSLNVLVHWQFGWDNYDTDYYTLDFNSEILFNDSGSITKYLATQYGRWIINKLVIVLDQYDVSRYIASSSKKTKFDSGAVMPDPFFDRSKLYLECYFPNNRDSFGVPVLGDRYEFVKRVPLGRRFKHTYYPRCRNTVQTKVGDMHGKLGDLLTQMGSPDKGRAIGYVGIGPLTDLPQQKDQTAYVKYVLSMSFNYYLYMTFTDRNIQMMI